MNSLDAPTFISNWTLAESAKTSIYDGITANEYIDPTLVDGFIHSNQGISYHKVGKYKGMPYDNEQQMIIKYRGLNVKDNQYSMKYSRAKHGWGRIQPEGNLSLSKIHRPTRHAFSSLYKDKDMNNCQPNMLCQIARSNGTPMIALEKYCADYKTVRQEIIDHHQLKDIFRKDESGKDTTDMLISAKDQAKNLPLRLTFGGCYAQWCREYNVKGCQIVAMSAVEMEIIKVIDVVFKSNPSLIKDVRSANKKKYDGKTADGKKRSVMGLFAQTLEKVAQESSICYFIQQTSHKLQDIIPCQDGFMHLDNGDDIDVAELSVPCSQLGLSIKWEEKLFDKPVLVVPYSRSEEQIYQDMNDENILHGKIPIVDECVEHDAHCAELLLQAIGNRIVKSKGTLYFKPNNIWLVERNTEDFLLQYILKCNLYTINKQGDQIPYSRNVPKAKNILVALLVNVPHDNNLWIDLHSSTEGKICFKNGVLDIPTKVFTSWKLNPNVQSCVVIDRDYIPFHKTTESMIVYNRIYNNILRTQFGTNVDKFLKIISRMLAGHMTDKAWIQYTGNRNCGKGILYELLSYSFGTDYISSFNIENIIASKKTMEADRLLHWAIPLAYSRIAVTQETPNDGSLYCGKVIKSVTSGGDTQRARKLNCEPIEFKFGAGIMSMSNNKLRADNDDVLDTCHEFTSCVQYMSQNDISAVSDATTLNEDEEDVNIDNADAMAYIKANIHVADDRMKGLVRSPIYMQAFFQIILDHYTNSKVSFATSTKTISKSKHLVLLQHVIKEVGGKLSNRDLKRIIHAREWKMGKMEMHAMMTDLGCSYDKKQCWWNGIRERCDVELAVTVEPDTAVIEDY